MAPSKNPKKCPIICFASDIKKISRTYKIRGTLVFLCPRGKKREREQEGERESEREREREKEKGREKGKGREREKKKCGRLDL